MTKGGQQTNSSEQSKQFSSTISKNSSPFASAFGQEFMSLISEANPLISAFSQNLLKSLSGDFYQLPGARSALSAAKSSTSNVMQQARAQFGRMGLGNDPVSQGILANTEASLNEGESQIPANMGNQYISGAGGFISSLLGGAGGFGGLAQSGSMTTTGQSTGTTSMTGSQSVTSNQSMDLGPVLSSIFQAAGAAGSFGALF